MTGTWINVAGIIVGALIGVAVKKGIPERINASVLKAEGLAIVIIALNGIIGAMFRADPATGKLTESGGLLLLVSLVLGCLAGEALRIEDRLNSLGVKLEERFGAAGFSKGFVTASLIFPIGAMAIIGALNDGLTGDSSVLVIKSLLDFTTSIILASVLGIGVLFSFIPVLLLQGGISLMAGVLAPLITEELLSVICMVGYALVLSIGVNFITDAKIKVANLLPALPVPIIYHIIVSMRHIPDWK